MGTMLTVRRAIRWITALVRKPFKRFRDRPEKPKRIASQVFSNGARMTVFSGGYTAILYSTKDYVRFGPGNEVIEIKTHDGVKWRKPFGRKA